MEKREKMKKSNRKKAATESGVEESEISGTAAGYAAQSKVVGGLEKVNARRHHNYAYGH